MTILNEPTPPETPQVEVTKADRMTAKLCSIQERKSFEDEGGSQNYLTRNAQVIARHRHAAEAPLRERIALLEAEVRLLRQDRIKDTSL